MKNIKETKYSILREFKDFIRLRICIFVAGLGVSGFVMFNQVDLRILFVALSCFFCGASGYTYNLVTDRDEDRINHKKINYFANSKYGVRIVRAFFVAGLMFAIFLSNEAVVFYMIMSTLNFSYSYFRMKKIFPFKNFFTGFGLTQIFFVGAANAPISAEMAEYYVMVSIFVLAASLISDLRDFEGDSATNIRTIPVVFGYEKSTKLVMGLIFYASATVIVMKLNMLLPILLFMGPILYFLNKDNPRKAHKNIMMSFIFLPLGVVIL